MRGITKDKKNLFEIVAVIVAVVLALLIGISVYSVPEHQLSRQLELGHKYLENGQYEEAILAFENAIAIDEKCTEAYIGGIEAYLLTEDREALPAFYDRAVAMIENSEEELLKQHMDDVVEIYLSADQVYDEAPEQAVEVLEKGWSRTEKTEIKDKLIDNYFTIVEKTNEIKNYQEELKVYDRLLELTGSDAKVLEALEKCLTDYMDFLTDEGKYDEIRMLADKYQDIAADIDFDAILSQAGERETLTEEEALQEEAGEEGEEETQEDAEPAENRDMEADITQDGSWVDDLYQKMIAGDAESVFAIMAAPDFIEKCEAFPHPYSSDYQLSTSDGKIIWVVTGEDFLSVAYSPNNYYAPDGLAPPVGEGDYVYDIEGGERSWLFKSTGHRDGSTFEMPEGAIWWVYHM